MRVKLPIGRVRIDQKHSAKLLNGDPVTVMVPRGAEAIEVRLTFPAHKTTEFERILATFFKN